MKKSINGENNCQTNQTKNKKIYDINNNNNNNNNNNDNNNKKNKTIQNKKKHWQANNVIIVAFGNVGFFRCFSLQRSAEGFISTMRSNYFRKLRRSREDKSNHLKFLKFRGT